MNSSEIRREPLDYCPVCGEDLINAVECRGQFLCSESCANIWDEMETLHDDLFAEEGDMT